MYFNVCVKPWQILRTSIKRAAKIIGLNHEILSDHVTRNLAIFQQSYHFLHQIMEQAIIFEICLSKTFLNLTQGRV